jgi:NarL family two-component system sensor histidine kinase LiaS
MRRLLRPFRRLQWQLTISYVLIALVAIGTFEVATVVNEIASGQSTVSPGPALAKMLANSDQQVAPYVDQPAPNQQALTAWVDQMAAYPLLSVSQGKLTVEAGNGQERPPSGQTTIVVLLNTSHQVLASSAGDAATHAFVQAPEAKAVLATAAAQVGQKALNYLDLARTLPDGRTVSAVPLVTYDGRFVGLALMAARVPSATPLQLLQSVHLDYGSAFAFLIFASVTGVLAGMLSSRRITHRLGRMAHAAEAWSHGDLHLTVQDAAHDELGRLAQNLNRMAEELNGLLATRQELAVVEERHRLARDLHDSVKQQMFVITMLVGAARPAVAGNTEAERTLREAERLAGQAQQELNAMIRTLRPAALDGKGLGDALRGLIDGWAEQTGITAAADLSCAVRMSAATEQALYRVTQEALANVARHSGATAVEARLATTSPESLTLCIQDNGHGFDPARHGDQGMGLRSMRERVETLGGILLIVSDVTGTRVEARIPLSAPLPDLRESAIRAEHLVGRHAE